MLYNLNAPKVTAKGVAKGKSKPKVIPYEHDDEGYRY